MLQGLWSSVVMLLLRFEQFLARKETGQEHANSTQEISYNILDRERRKSLPNFPKVGYNQTKRENHDREHYEPNQFLHDNVLLLQ